MKFAKKLFKLGLLGTLLIVVVVALLLWMIGENAIKVGVEAGASKALDVGVEIDDIDISIFKGQLGIQGLEVRNPQGYELKNLLELKKGKIKLELKSLMSDTVKIEEFKLDGITLVLEQKGMTNNLQEIIKKLEKPAAKEESAPGKEEPKKGKNIEIAELEITNVKVKVKLIPMPGQTKTIDLELGPIKMQNLGTDKKMDTGVLASKILVAITEGIANQGIDILPADMVKGLSGTLEASSAAIEKGKELFESGKETGKEIVEGLKGIFKKKDE